MNSELRIHCFTPAAVQDVFELELAYARAFPGAVMIPAEAYLSPGFHQGRDVFCAQRGERLLAYAPVYVQPAGEGAGEQPNIAWAEIKAQPELVDPYPVKDALLERLAARAREIVAEAQLYPRQVRLTFEYRANETPAIDYVLTRGFCYTQSTFQMVRDLLEPVPEAPLPQGLHMQRWKMEREAEQRAYVTARNECFPHAPITLENWQYYMKSTEWENGTTIACFEGEELAGNVNVYWNEDEIQAAGVRFGCTEDIFVRPERRGRGIARAMVAEGMRFLQENGMAQARLSVAAKNETALGLYTGLGYRVKQESKQFAKDF